MFTNYWHDKFKTHEEAFKDVLNRFTENDWKRFVWYQPQDDLIETLFMDNYHRKEQMCEWRNQAIQEFFDVNYWWDENE